MTTNPYQRKRQNAETLVVLWTGLGILTLFVSSATFVMGLLAGLPAIVFLALKCVLGYIAATLVLFLIAYLLSKIEERKEKRHAKAYLDNSAK